MEMFLLNDPIGRIELAHHLYNLVCKELDQDQDQDAQLAIDELHHKIKGL
jgi:hypothetical protein